MDNNKKFVNLLRQLIKEAIKKREPLLESPVRSQTEILAENKINQILKSK